MLLLFAITGNVGGRFVFYSSTLPGNYARQGPAERAASERIDSAAG